MAVTNHPKDQFLPPKWAQRGKLRLVYVPGGTPETGTLLSSRGEWKRQRRPYTPALVRELAAKKFNAVCLIWSAGGLEEVEREQQELVKPLLPLLKAKRIRAVAEISLEWRKLETRRVSSGAIHRAAVAPDAERRFISTRRLTANRADRADLRRRALAALDAGFDGLFFSDAKPEHANLLSDIRLALRRARVKGAPEPLFYCDSWSEWPVNDLCNFKCKLLTWPPGMYGEGACITTNLIDLKYLFEDGGRDKPVCAELGAAQNALSTAEVLASGGTAADLDVPRNYQLFHAKKSTLFGSADPINSVGVLVDTPDFDPVMGWAWSVELLRNNIQFDVIPATQHSRFDFHRYRLLTATYQSRMDDALIAALDRFVRIHGGTLLTTDLTDEPFKNSAPPFFYFPRQDQHRAEKPFGNGWIVRYGPQVWRKEDPREAIKLLPHDPMSNALGRAILEDIRRFAGPQPIEVAAPDGVVALLWGKGTKRWVHVLNYRAERSDATITLPNCGGRKITAHSPDEHKPALKVLETGKARAVFALSGIQTYAVVEVV